MHTTTIRETIFLHNGDCSGDVTIRDGGGSRVTVPIEDMLDLVAQIVASKRISALERATYKDIFNID